MKREIKFRAWTGSGMEHNVTVGKFGAFYVNPGSKGDGLNEKDSACLTEFNTIYSEQTPIMQFTGLLDKNGKEIYEGDVVVWHDSSENVDRGWSRTAVVRINPDLYFQCFKVGGKPHDHDFHYGNFIWKETDKYFEIVGNIYENPELVK